MDQPSFGSRTGRKSSLPPGMWLSSLTLFFFKRFDFIDAPLVSSSGKGSGEPHFYNLFCEVFPDNATADHKDIGVVVFAAASGGIEIVN
jgi:hypothetical protein